MTDPTRDTMADDRTADYDEMITVTRDYLRTHNHNVSRELMKELYGVVVRGIFKSLFKRGRYLFPAGLGSLRLRRLGETRRRSPRTKQLFKVQRERMSVRYHMGTALMKRLGYENDYRYTPKKGYEDGLAGIKSPNLTEPKVGV